ncbi:hypothetical protein [Streptomyces sp. NPDC051561]|uniref:hypothetical protein n=1 Tax=Streptomyces sp. NPDC051561 TaxID=3365658 RepID=UPI0037B06BB3
MEQQTFTEQAGVTYAVVGKGKRVHYSPRNDETLCGRALTEYLDGSDAAALFGKGHELCAPCHRAAEKRAEARRLADASPLAAALVDLVDTIEQADAEQAAADGTWRGAWIGAQEDAETLFPIERDTEQGALFTDRAAVEPVVVEGAVVEHAGTAQGSTPGNALHPDVAAARVALDSTRAALMTEHHDVSDPAEDERSVRGYLVEPRGHGRVALYWIEEGRSVCRDGWYGPSLDHAARTMERAGWTVEKMARSSQCVFAHRPAEDAAPAAVEPAAPKCRHDIAVRPDVSGNPIATCDRKQSNQEAGAFDDEGLLVEAYDCAVQAANRAAEWNAADDDSTPADPSYTWDLLCADHRDNEQQVDECEECNAEEAAADVIEQAAVEEAPRCRMHGAACDGNPKRRHEFEATAEQVEVARETRRQAKAKVARIAELDDVLAMIEQAERADGTWRGEWIAAAPTDAELLALPADAEQGALFA